LCFLSCQLFSMMFSEKRFEDYILIIMAKTAEASMNVSALKLADQYVHEIIDNAAHVVLYNFNSETYEWEKTNVEGALFLYSRSVEPKYKLFILNRLNTMNLMEPITEGLDLQLEEPFLLYRSSKGKINGVWFYVRDECVRIAQTVEKLVKEVSNDQSKMNMALHSCPYNNPLQPGESNFKSPNKSKHTKVDESSRKVMDFFAKARDKIPLHPPRGFVVPGSGLQFQAIKQESEVQHTEVNPILKKLMANPLKTVEQIEREHKAVTLMEALPTQRKSQKKEKSQTRVPRPLSLNVNSGGINQSDIENGFSYLQLSESPPETFNSTGSLQTHQFYNSCLKSSPPSEPLEVSVLERSVKVPLPLSTSSSKTPTKPALIPPVMFTGSIPDDPPLEVIKQEPISIDVQPEPLTKSQLLQAVSYLLKNDADFVNKLHEAYVKSFVDLVS